MLNSDNNGNTSIDLLEAKVKELLESFRELKSENDDYKNQVKSGQSVKVILDSAKRRQMRKKIESLLEYLDDF